MPLKRDLGYAQAVNNAVDLLCRIRKAHDKRLDHILHDIELSLVEQKDFTREKYLGIYRTFKGEKQTRITIPSSVTPAEAYHVYLTEWGDIIYRPVVKPFSGTCAPIMVGS